MTIPGAAVGCFVIAIAWAGAAHIDNPYEGNERARRAGAKLYARECAACHGQEREGRGKAPPLNRPEVGKAQPGALFWILRNGSLRRGMPSFAHLPEAQRWQIITYLQGCITPRSDTLRRGAASRSAGSLASANPGSFRACR